MIPATMISAWRFFPAWIWTALFGVVACIVIGAACYSVGKGDGLQLAAERSAIASLAAERRDAAAKEVASAQRVIDILKTEDLKKELRDAVQNLPDATPSNRRRALGCARLRSQGTDISDLPECR